MAKGTRTMQRGFGELNEWGQANVLADQLARAFNGRTGVETSMWRS